MNKPSKWGHDQLGHDADIYETLAAMAAGGRQGVLATVTGASLSTPRHLGSKMIIHADGTLTGSVGGGRAEALVLEAAAEVLAQGRCRSLDLDLAQGLGVCGGNMQIFLEPVLRTTPLIVCGAGHVGRALAEMARLVSFHVTLVDDRPEFLETWQDQPGVRTLAAGAGELASHLVPEAGAALVVATRSHELDQEHVAALLELEKSHRTNWGFFGVLGSRRKIGILRRRLLETHADCGPRLDSLQMPVGLAVGSETPHEIALSILAEVLAVLRGVAYVNDPEEGGPLGIPLQRRWRRPEST